MKRILVLGILLLCIFACKDDDNPKAELTNDIVGRWQLIEIYSDPGDGSGDFSPIDSEKTIEFMNDGSFSSNANLCFVFSDIGEASAGTYSESDGFIIVADCDITPITASFEFSNSNLIVSYPCIEGCQEKYVKIE